METIKNTTIIEKKLCVICRKKLLLPIDGFDSEKLENIKYYIEFCLFKKTKYYSFSDEVIFAIKTSDGDLYKVGQTIFLGNYILPYT